MSNATALKLTPEEILREQIASFRYDPLGYVLFAFPWGEGVLAGFDGPDKWQADYLTQLGVEISKRDFNPLAPHPVAPIQMATSSGHGIGKITRYMSAEECAKPKVDDASFRADCPGGQVVPGQPDQVGHSL